MVRETTMQEWVDDYSNMFIRGERHSPYAHTTNKVDKTLKYCVKCKMCWEKFRNAKGKQWTKYEKNHIPIINKKKVLCPPCKSKEKK
jgi:hypothetical protein|tara:strand:+ start:470 stop:730 length:261 start_codon:yes stop_codon:yes gene_type:complete